MNLFLLMCLNRWWVFISCLHAPRAGQAGGRNQLVIFIKVKSMRSVGHSAVCIWRPTRNVHTSGWFMSRGWLLWYLIEIALWNGRLHKRPGIINKLHNCIPEVSRVVKIYLQLIRVHICGTGLTLLWALRWALNATIGDSVINCLEPAPRMASYPTLTWPRK